jgi:uncharacterized protein (DUF169 family)
MKLYEALEQYGRFPTLPVGVKLAKEGEEIPQKARYPLKDIGNRLSACQGLNIARIFGWTLAFGKKDHACPLASVFLGHAKPDVFLEGAIAGFYQDREECGRKMEGSFPRLPLNSIQEVWLSPLHKAEFRPDLAVVYGNPGQIVNLIHAANFRDGASIKSSSCGRGGCASWMAGVIQSGECTYMIPGAGERVFAGTQDHEMSFAIPHSRFENFIEGLEFIKKQRVFKYPIPNLAILSEPRIPEKYYVIDPERQAWPES